MSASQQLLRTATTSPIAGSLISGVSPYKPSDPICAAPHGYESFAISPTTGTFGPNQTCMIEFPVEVDLITKANLRYRLNALVFSSALDSGHFTNGIGISNIDTLQLQFGTEKLQLVRMEELYAKAHTMFIDEDKANLRDMMAFDTVPNLIDRAKRPQTIIVPLLTLLHLGLGGDPGHCIPTRMLGEKVKLYIKFRPINQWIHQYNVAGTVSLGGTTISSTTLNCTTCFDDTDVVSGVYFDGEHIFEDEREDLEAISTMPRRILFSEQQYVSGNRFATTTATTAMLTIDLREATQPVTSVFVFLRWAADLDRVLADTTTGVGRGYTPWNHGGWYDNCGTGLTTVNLPLVKWIRVDTGSNLYALKQIDSDTLMKYDHLRKFKSTNTTGVFHWTYSHDPARPNAQLGFQDWSQTDLPRLRIQLQNPGSTATLGDASTNDIGFSSQLDVMVVLFTHNLLHAHMNAFFHPFN